MLIINHIFNIKLNITQFVELVIIVQLMKNAHCELSSKYVVAKEEDEFKEAYDLFEFFTTEDAVNLSRITTPPPVVSNYWMMKMGEIRDDLLYIQAFIVKDKDVEGPCTEGHQKSQHRHLMCAGSILSRNKVLTSASCLQEAIQLRHNLRAPLSVVIAPLKSTVQVIRVAEYRMHPKHDSNPYSDDHTKHNMAILNLACRISSVNYHKIDLPSVPMTHMCTEENCIIAVYRKSGDLNVIYQISASHIPLYDRRRRSIIDESKSKINKWNKRIETDVSYNYIENETMKNCSVHNVKKRSSNGLNNCPQSGAAVMVNRTQTAIVAVSCDDRQKTGTLLYTDVYHNLDWINSILKSWNKTDHNVTETTNVQLNKTQLSKNCGNCIFNFYISVGCKGKRTCPKNHEVLNNQQARMTQNTRQISNQEFMEVWSQVQKDPNSFIARPGDRDIDQGSSYNPRDKCPNNSPECLQSLSVGGGEVRRRIPVNRIIAQNGVNLVGLEQAKRYFMNNPITIRSANHSHVNDLNKKFGYYPNFGRRNFGNQTWIPRKANNSVPLRHNIYGINKLNNKNGNIGEVRNNWLRRRHANTYVNPRIN